MATRIGLDRAAAAGAVTFALAFGVDLATKAHAVSRGSAVYNSVHAGDFPRRIVMSVVAVAATYVLARLARRRGLGRLWGAWIGAGLLAGGVLANGVSQFIWANGVPDFIRPPGPQVWNLADFEIGLGLAGGLASVAATALVRYALERVRSRRFQNN